MQIHLNPFSNNLEKTQREFINRYEGRYDEFGFDLDSFIICEFFFRFLFENYFKVQVIGIENIPEAGRAVLVGNHSGGLPIDAFMTNSAIYNLHPHPRRIRCLSLKCLREVPILKDIVTGMGGVPASFSVAQNLLLDDELVMFYPEGPRGTGKLFSQRYRLNDFDPGFVKAAMATGSPIIPITVVGADELYPIFKNLKGLARLLHMPYFPLTPLFPWFPLFISCIPLPIRMLIKIGKPIYLNYPAEEVSNKRLRLRVTREIQFQIQKELNTLLSQRKSPLAGWDLESLNKT